MVIKYNLCCQFVTAPSHNHCCKNFAQRGKHITSTVIYHRLTVITDGNKSASSSYFESCLSLVNSSCFHTSMHFTGGGVSPFHALAPCLTALYKKLVHCRYRKKTLTFPSVGPSSERNVSHHVSLWRTTNARNVRLHFPYRQYLYLNTAYAAHYV